MPNEKSNVMKKKVKTSDLLRSAMRERVKRTLYTGKVLTAGRDARRALGLEEGVPGVGIVGKSKPSSPRLCAENSSMP